MSPPKWPSIRDLCCASCKGVLISREQNWRGTCHTHDKDVAHTHPDAPLWQQWNVPKFTMYCHPACLQHPNHNPAGQLDYCALRRTDCARRPTNAGSTCAAPSHCVHACALRSQASTQLLQTSLPPRPATVGARPIHAGPSSGSGVEIRICRRQGSCTTMMTSVTASSVVSSTYRRIVTLG